jgi:hypothetical protein
MGEVGLPVISGARKSSRREVDDDLLTDDDAPILPPQKSHCTGSGQTPASRRDAACRRLSVGKVDSDDVAVMRPASRKLSVSKGVSDEVDGREEELGSQYEQLRQKNIDCNQAMLINLGIEKIQERSPEHKKTLVQGEKKQQQKAMNSAMDHCRLQTQRRNPPRGQRAEGHTDKQGRLLSRNLPRGEGLAHDRNDPGNQPNDNAWDDSDHGSSEDDDESDDSGSDGVVTCNTELARESACNPPNLTYQKRPFLVMCTCPQEKRRSCPESGYPCRYPGLMRSSHTGGISK